MRLDRADVILAVSWFYDKQDSLYIDYVHHSLVFVKDNYLHVAVSLCKNVSVNNGFAIPVVSALEIFKDIKSLDVDLYRCLLSILDDSIVFGTMVTEFRQSVCWSSIELHDSDESVLLQEIMTNFKDVFLNELPPPLRGVDHAIEVVVTLYPKSCAGSWMTKPLNAFLWGTVMRAKATDCITPIQRRL